MMNVPPMQKAVALAVIRCLLSLTFVYIIVGCVLYPEWWKEFALQGGFLKWAFWQDGIGFIVDEFKRFAPLAAISVLMFLGLACYLAYWLGKHANHSDGKKAAFIEKVAPSTGAVVCIAIVLITALFSAGIQKRSYSAQKPRERFDERLGQMLDEYDRTKTTRFFDAPQSGIYLYLNEKLILEQNESLRDEFDVTSITDSTGSEKAASASLPIAVVAVDVSGKQTAERTVTQSAPELSATIAAKNLIRRFNDSTNTFQMKPFGTFSGSSDWVVRHLQSQGVELSKQQIEKLHAGDILKFQEDTQLLRARKILLWHGSLAVYPNGDKLMFEAESRHAASIYLKGHLEKEGVREHLRYSLDLGKGKSQLPGMSGLFVIQKVETEGNGNITMTVVPYALW